MANELKPCPFCGGVAELIPSTECGGFGLYAKTVTITCIRCGATGGSFSDFDHGEKSFKKKAISAWNTRYEENNDESKNTCT